MTASKAAGPKLIAVGAGKGGVGKSTVSTNLAVALARLGHKVGIIDADIYGPSQPTLLGTSERPEAKDKQLIPVEVQGVKMLSVGQLVSPGHALAWRGPMASGALAQLVEGDWTGTEIIIVDLPPGTGDVQLSLIQKSRPVGAVVVSTPQDLSLIDARRAIDLFGKTSVPVLGIIENMAGYQCPHCGETSDPFGSGGAEAAAAEMGVPFLGRLPLVGEPARVESDAGRPPAGGDGTGGGGVPDAGRSGAGAASRLRRWPPSCRAPAASARRSRGAVQGRTPASSVANICFKLPAMVISATAAPISPPSTRKPAAPRL